MQMLKGILINANLGCLLLIYLALLNVTDFLGTNLYWHGKMKLNCIKTCEDDTKLNQEKQGRNAY